MPGDCPTCRDTGIAHTAPHIAGFTSTLTACTCEAGRDLVARTNQAASTRCYHTELLARLGDEPDSIGTIPGETCNRVQPPDEDAPRGYRPRPCGGEMIDSDGVAVCDTCGETA